MLSFCSAFCLLLSVQSESFTAEQVLEKVEQVSVTCATADITYVKIDPVLERREIRLGALVYRSCTSHKDAAIAFDTLIIGRRKETRAKRYVFSGRWFVEINPEQKQFIKRDENRKIGRNEKCPCNSGKKYKRCCGRGRR